jgi:glycosyl transferase family 25
MNTQPLVLLINLDRDTDRLAAARQRLLAEGLECERVSAVLGTNVPGALADQFRMSFAGMRPGEIGCYASHLVAAERFLDSGQECAVVLEDDIDCRPGAADVIASAIDHAPVGWDFIGLCADSRRAMRRIANLSHGRALVRFSRYPWGTAGYLVSRTGALKMLAPRPRMIPIDLQIRQPWTLGLDAYGVYPPVIGNAALPSTIDALDGGVPMRRAQKVPSSISGVLWYVRTLGVIGVARCALSNTLKLDKPAPGHSGPIIG